MNWQDAAALSTIISSVVVAISVLFALRQLVEMRRSTSLSAYMKIVDILQTEDARHARKCVLTELKTRKFTDWTEADVAEAEKVCHTLDTVGRLVEFSLCPRDVVVDSHGDSIKKCWAVLEPFVRSYQEQRGPNFWDDFERLAEAARNWKPNKQI